MKQVIRAILTASLLTLGFIPTMAMPTVSYSGLSNSGVELVPSDSPEFSRVLKQYVEPKSLDLIQSILPYTVIVKNNSRERLLMVTIRISARDETGRTTFHDITLGTRNSNSVNMVAPGCTVLITPEPGLNTILRAGTLLRIGDQDTDTTLKGLLRVAGRYRQKAQVDIALDSVVFEDGHLVGPDSVGILAMVNSMADAEDSVISGALPKSGDELKGYLGSLKDGHHLGDKDLDLTADEQSKAPDNQLQQNRTRLASELLAQRKAFQSDSEFHRYLQTKIDSRIPRLWRKP